MKTILSIFLILFSASIFAQKVTLVTVNDSTYQIQQEQTDDDQALTSEEVVHILIRTAIGKYNVISKNIERQRSSVVDIASVRNILLDDFGVNLTDTLGARYEDNFVADNWQIKIGDAAWVKDCEIRINAGGAVIFDDNTTTGRIFPFSPRYIELRNYFDYTVQLAKKENSNWELWEGTRFDNTIIRLRKRK